MSDCPDIQALEREVRAPEVAEHLRTCDACRRVAELIDDRAGTCEEIELLLAAATLTPEQSVRLERHLATCPACRELAAVAGEGDDGEAPPPRYQLGREVGRGGMGRVLHAHDRQLERPVAVKVLGRGVGHEAAARFRREALITARLQHPSIVAVYEMGRLPTGEPFYAMRKIKGRTLEDALGEASTPDRRLALLPTVLAAAEAVAYAHSEGVIHRDLKPSNVMIGPFGETLVLDWGVAKLVGEPEPELSAGPFRATDRDDLTADGAVLGTPQYMAPEQARAEPVDERSDVYALGAILYALLAGRPPYDGRTSREVLEQVRRDDPPPIDEVAADAPGDLRAIVRKAMARDPGARYPTAGALADDLRRFHTGKLVSAHSYSTAALLRRWLRRNRALVAAVTLLLAALVVVSAFSFHRVVRERDRAESQRQRATRTSLTLLEEQGRQHLLAGEPLRAAVYLSAAYSAGLDDPSLRFLLAQAMRSVDARSAPLADMRPRTDARFSPDGALVAGPATGGLGIWDVATGALRRTVPGDLCLAWSLDGRRIAIGGKGFVSIRDVASGAEVRHADFAWWGDMHWALDLHGDRLFGAASEGGLGYLDVATGKHAPFRPAGLKTASIGFTPDGTRLVTSDSDGAIRLWDPVALRVVTTLGGPDQQVLVHQQNRAGIFDRRGRLVTPGPGDDATVWDLASAKPVLRLAGRGGQVLTAEFSPDGRSVVTGTEAGVIQLWDASTGALRHTIEAGPSAVLAYFAAGGTRVIASSFAGTSVTVWDPRSGIEVARFHGTAQPSNRGDRFLLTGSRPRLIQAGGDGLVATLPFDLPAWTETMSAEKIWQSRDGARLMLEDPHGGFAVVVDVARRAVVEQLASPRGGDWIASIDHDGVRVLARGADGVLAVRPVGKAAPRVALQDPPAAVGYAVFGPDDARLLVASATGEAGLWDVATGRRLARLDAPVAPGVTGVVTAGGQRIVTAAADGTATVWDGTGRQLATYKPPRGRIDAVRLVPGGRSFLLYARLDGPGSPPVFPHEVTLWRATDGTRLADLGRLAAAPDAVWGDIDPSGRVGLFGHALWNLDTGAHLGDLDGPGFVVRVAAFSPDASLVAAGGGFSGDEGARVVRVADRSLVSIVGQESGQVFVTVFGPAGRLVVTMAADGAIAIWDPRTGGELTRVPSAPALWHARVDADGYQVSSQVPSVVFSRDGRELFVIGSDTLQIWDLHLETRTPDQIAALVAARVPWRLDDGRLVPASR